MKRRATGYFDVLQRACAIACLALFFPAWSGGVVVALAEDAPVAASGKDPHSNADRDRLPPPAITEQTVDLGERVLKFKASIGAMPIKGESGELLAEVVTTAFTLSGATTSRRRAPAAPSSLHSMEGRGLVRPGSVSARWVHGACR
jgi:hypothetical protein